MSRAALLLYQSGNKKQVQIIVTSGGAFPDGFRIIKEGWKQVNYFNSPQRLNKLEPLQAAFNLPVIRLETFPTLG